MFNTHWILAMMSFFPAGIACGLLGINPEGFFFITILFSLCWLHLGFYFVCQVFLELEIGNFPVMALWIALGCFILGYIIAYGHDNSHSFSIALLAWGLFFLHDFVFGVVLLFSGSTLRGMLVRMPPIRRPSTKKRFYAKISQHLDN